MATELEKLGARVRALRERAELSQEEVGERADLHRTYIGGVERGERNVSYLNLRKIAAALGVSVVDLVSDGDTM